MTKMISVEAWLRKQLKDPEFRKEYDALEPEFALARELIGARATADCDVPMRLATCAWRAAARRR